jgi:hypothetical protein
MKSNNKKEFVWNKDTIATYVLKERPDKLYNLSFIPKGRLYGELYIPSITKTRAKQLIKEYTGKTVE